MKFFTQCYNQEPLEPLHFLVYLIDPQYCGSDLTDEKQKRAFDFAKKKYSSNFIELIMKFLAKADPFYEILFDENVVT